MAAALERPDQLRWLLRSGAAETDLAIEGYIEDVLEDLKMEHVYLSPWGRFAKPVSPAGAKEIEQLLRAIARPWSRSTHAIFHEGARRAVETMFLSAGRIATRVGIGGRQSRRVKMLPAMPAECWMHIASFFRRENWIAAP